MAVTSATPVANFLRMLSFSVSQTSKSNKSGAVTRAAIASPNSFVSRVVVIPEEVAVMSLDVSWSSSFLSPSSAWFSSASSATFAASRRAASSGVTISTEN